jgi:transcriptional regulator with XRE-family HTH domain
MQRELTFGAYLKQRRHALDLTQEEVAEQVGCATETIRKLEAGGRRPSKEIAQRLAAQLTQSPEERAAFVQLARGIIGVEHAQAVDGPQPSASLDQRGSQLPAYLTNFVGRAREIAAVQTLLTRPSVRLLTLVGPPGIGKTRLSLHLAADLELAFSDGVVFVPLEALTDSALVASALAHRLGLLEQPGVLLPKSITHYLHPKHLLLVLDNFERHCQFIGRTQ